MEGIILNIVVILGIIIAGGFLIFFLGDLLFSIVDPKGAEDKIKNKASKNIKKFEEVINLESDETKKEILNNDEVKEVLAINQNDNLAPKDAIVEDLAEINEEELEEKALNNDEDNQIEDKLENARQSLETRKAEIIERMRQSLLDEENEEDEDLTNLDDEEDEVEEEIVENTNEELSDEELSDEELSDEEDFVEEVFEDTEVADNLEDVQEEDDAVELLKEKLEAQRLEFESKMQEYEDKINKQNNLISNLNNDEVGIANTLSAEDAARVLEEKSEQLSKNEKQLRACKKEFLPLDRVRKTLEKDEKKLRIKEARVAKQKVLLYGVNNLEDIDEEKSKKLNEEIELLEALKQSVEHCEEVMRANEERFPVLDELYNVLKEQNATLKAEVEGLEKIVNEE